MEPTTVQSIIQIGSIEALFGVATIFVGIGIAWGTLKRDVKSLEHNLGKLETLIVDVAHSLTSVQSNVSDIRTQSAVTEDRVETLWRDKFAPSQSPRKLNERGHSILEQSGIKDIVNEKENALLEIIRSKNPTTAYDTENVIFAVVADLPKHCPNIINRLKDGAFKSGADIDAVLFVGGIYLRDKIFPALGFSLTDLD